LVDKNRRGKYSFNCI